jgi:hypothetical protein
LIHQETAVNTNTPAERKNPPGASEGTREALDSTTRPLRSDDAGNDNAQPGQEDTSLRNLAPRSTRDQFGDEPEIEVEADQASGVKEWVHESSEMEKSFPDDGQPKR